MNAEAEAEAKAADTEKPIFVALITHRRSNRKGFGIMRRKSDKVERVSSRGGFGIRFCGNGFNSSSLSSQIQTCGRHRESIVMDLLKCGYLVGIHILHFSTQYPSGKLS